MTLDEVKFLLKIIAACVGLGTFIKIVLEYTKSQKWKKAEFLANEYIKFITSSHVQATIQMLDGFELPIHLPLANGTIFSINFKKQNLGEAFTKDGKGEYPTSADSVHIMQCFDKFLFRLGLFQAHIKNNLIQRSAFDNYFSNLIDMIWGTNPQITSSDQTLINAYIKENNFTLLIEMLTDRGVTV